MAARRHATAPRVWSCAGLVAGWSSARVQGEFHPGRITPPNRRSIHLVFSAQRGDALKEKGAAREGGAEGGARKGGRTPRFTGEGSAGARGGRHPR